MDDNRPKNVEKNGGHDLRGTFIFVMLLGIFMIASWFAIYILYVSR